MGKEADRPPPAVWNGSLGYSHRQTADLPAFVAKKDVLDGSDLHFDWRLSLLLKPQGATCNGQSPICIVGGSFETQYVGHVHADRRIFRLMDVLAKGGRKTRNGQDQACGNRNMSPAGTTGPATPRNSCAIHVLSKVPIGIRLAGELTKFLIHGLRVRDSDLVLDLRDRLLADDRHPLRSTQNIVVGSRVLVDMYQELASSSILYCARAQAVSVKTK